MGANNLTRAFNAFIFTAVFVIVGLTNNPIHSEDLDFTVNIPAINTAIVTGDGGTINITSFTTATGAISDTADKSVGTVTINNNHTNGWAITFAGDTSVTHAQGKAIPFKLKYGALASGPTGTFSGAAGSATFGSSPANATFTPTGETSTIDATLAMSIELDNSVTDLVTGDYTATVTLTIANQ